MFIDYRFEDYAKAYLAHDRLKSEGITVCFNANKLAIPAEIMCESKLMIRRIEFPDSEADRAKVILSRFGLRQGERTSGGYGVTGCAGRRRLGG
jgi:hypothetical protein